MENNFNEQLLNQVIDLKNKYNLVNKLNATEFNIFQILKVHNNERYTHSALIAELLNCNGKHGQGTLFLGLFIQCIKTEIFNENDKEDIQIKTEVYTGDKSQKGYIDIVLESNSKFLVIENKINALDQSQQLTRYENYAKKTKKTFKIIYLTLKGDDAAEQSAKNLANPYIRLSYEKDIRYWLEECIKEVGRKPVIRETIYQYIQIIKLICGIPLNHEEEMELKALLNKTFENLKAASIIHDNYRVAKFEVKYKFWEEVHEEIKEYFKLNEKWTVSKLNFDIDDRWPSINIDLKEHDQLLRFRIEKLQGDYYYGISKHSWNNLPAESKQAFFNHSSEFKFDVIENHAWIWNSCATDNFDNFFQMETLEKVFKNRTVFKQEIINKFLTFFNENHIIVENILKET